MMRKFLRLNPNTLETDDIIGELFRVTDIGGNTITEFWYVNEIVLNYTPIETGVRVVAKVYNHLAEFNSDFNDKIIFECGGLVQDIQSVNGVAEISINVPRGTMVRVATANVGVRNGEVVIRE